MNRWLILASVALLVGAVVLWATAPRPKPQASSPSQPPGRTAQTPEAADCGHQHAPVVPGPAEQPPQATPTAVVGVPESAAIMPATPPVTLKPVGKEPLSFDQASGRPHHKTIPVQAGASITLPAMPDAGEAEILVRSTMGGVEVQKHVAGRFRALPDGQVEIAGIQPDTTLRVGFDKGVLRIVAPPAGLDPTVSNAVVEVARTVLMLRSSLRGGPVTASAEVSLGGDPYRLIQAGEGWAILAATRDANDGNAFADCYPTTPGAWNDVCAWVDGEGHMYGIERLAVVPETPETTGFLVRRTVLRFPR